MNKRLIFILLFFFALFIPLIFNSPSRIYEVFAGGPIAPSPFGAGPVVPPGGGSSGTGGTTIPVQTPVAGKAFNGWTGTSFSTVTLPTPGPTATPFPASTPVATQYMTGIESNGTVDRQQIDYSELANPPTLGTIVTHGEGDFLASTLLGASEGVAPLDINSLVPLTSLPTIPDTKLSSNGTLWKNTGTNTAVAASTHDFSGAAWLKLPIVAGVYGSSAQAMLYLDSTDKLLHYHNGDADIAISNIPASGAITCAAAANGNSMNINTAMLEWCSNDGLTTKYAAYGDSAGKAVSAAAADKDLGTQEKCKEIPSLAAADDNSSMGWFATAVHITGVSCKCHLDAGGACTADATFTLHKGGTGGGAMTITGTNPTCTTQGTNAAFAAVTAGNDLAIGEDFSFDVTNTPTNAGAVTYEVCVSYTRDP